MTGFTSNSISSLKTINLHITFGDKLCSKMILTKFMVVDIPSIYNVTIGRPILNRLRVVVSTYYMVIKFSIRTNIEELRSNLKELC